MLYRAAQNRVPSRPQTRDEHRDDLPSYTHTPTGQASGGEIEAPSCATGAGRSRLG
jgi:hypothetical protein